MMRHGRFHDARMVADHDGFDSPDPSRRPKRRPYGWLALIVGTLAWLAIGCGHPTYTESLVGHAPTEWKILEYNCRVVGGHLGVQSSGQIACSTP